jgi:hypothetical protein
VQNILGVSAADSIHAESSELRSDRLKFRVGHGVRRSTNIESLPPNRSESEDDDERYLEHDHHDERRNDP